MSLSKFLFVIIIIFISASCKRKEEPKNQNFDLFSLYISKDTSLNNDGIYTPISVVDKKIHIPVGITLESKIRILLDSISIYYFHGLTIEIVNIDSSNYQQKILIINLKEKPDFTIPGSLGSYQCWYDYFQGSTGGLNTTTELKESILQRNYHNKWIDGLRVMYQGDSIGDWDHIDLNGLILRN